MPDLLPAISAIIGLNLEKKKNIVPWSEWAKI
jgi:hypothetical protein